MTRVAGLDPISITHPATAHLARKFMEADSALRGGFGATVTGDGHRRREAAYEQAMRALHEAEDAIPGEEHRGMAHRSVFDEIAARGLKAEGPYVLCGYRPTGYRRVEGPHVFAPYLRFDTLAAAIAYAEAEIIGPESGFLPWMPTGDSRRPGLVADVWLRVDHGLDSTGRRLNLAGQRWKVLQPVGLIGIQSQWAHDQHVGDRVAEIAFGGRPTHAEIDLVTVAARA